MIPSSWLNIDILTMRSWSQNQEQEILIFTERCQFLSWRMDILNNNNNENASLKKFIVKFLNGNKAVKIDLFFISIHNLILHFLFSWCFWVWPYVASGGLFTFPPIPQCHSINTFCTWVVLKDIQKRRLMDLLLTQPWWSQVKGCWNS